jgi:hypothetical protein
MVRRTEQELAGLDRGAYEPLPRCGETAAASRRVLLTFLNRARIITWGIRGVGIAFAAKEHCMISLHAAAALAVPSLIEQSVVCLRGLVVTPEHTLNRGMGRMHTPAFSVHE